MLFFVSNKGKTKNDFIILFAKGKFQKHRASQPIDCQQAKP